MIGSPPAEGSTASVPRGAIRRRDWLVLVACAVLAGLAMLTNVFISPDHVYDEVVYTQAAHNIATGWHLTWTNQPMFVHPPLSFLAQAVWLHVTGQVRVPLLTAVHAARVLSAATGAVDVVLLAGLAYRLAAGAPPGRRRVLTIAVTVVSAFDPILLRYSRLAIIEPFALCLSLVALHLAWILRERRTLTYVAAVGLTSGMALLTKEITIFLLLSPLLFSLLERDRRQVRRAFGALGLALGFWLLYPLWAVELGLARSFVDIQTATLQRLVGLIQISGWNRPGASFAGAVQQSVSQYASSYVMLALGGVTVCWLWARRNSSAGNFLTAWLTTSYAFAAYIVGVGTLNEQFFVYIVPAAIVGTVFLADGVLFSGSKRPGRSKGTEPIRSRRPRRISVTAVGLAAVGVLLASTTSWVDQYATAGDGAGRIVRTMQATLPACTVVNTSGDVDKYQYLLGGRPVAAYAVGPAALAWGIHDFILGPHDAVAHYGNMSPQLAAWIQANGHRLADFPSRTYDTVQLWQVPATQHDPNADTQFIPRGVYVNTVGSRCGGYTITDDSGGRFYTGYANVGGKAVVGAPLSRDVATSAGRIQVFDGIVLQTTGSGLPVTALPVVADLAHLAPRAYLALGLPNLPPIRSTVAAGSQLTDPAIARLYLGGARLTPATLAVATRLYGRPLGPAVTVAAHDLVLQPFANVVLERRFGSAVVVAASLGRTVLGSGVLNVPAAGLRPVPAPALPIATGTPERTTVLPFVISFGSAVVLLALAVAVLRRRRRPTPPGRANLDAAGVA